MFGFDIGVTWQWLIAGLALMALEIMLPGVFLLWFGSAAIVTSVVAFLAPDAITWQFAVFAVCSVVSILIFRKYVKKAIVVEIVKKDVLEGKSRSCQANEIRQRDADDSLLAE